MRQDIYILRVSANQKKQQIRWTAKKNVDLCLFPPRKWVLMEEIKRSWYIVKLYKNAALADPLANYTVLGYGFELIDGYVK